MDVNKDGWDDIFISNGPGNRQDNMLYLNRGDGAFEAVTSGDIVSDNSSSDGATFADADNDGDLDAFVVTWYGQPDYFYLNDGSGNFTRQMIPGATGTYSETASWGDYDGDGLVDLFITVSDGDKRNLLYRNLGEGQLEKVAPEGWLADAHFSRSVQWTDYDKDGDPDLFVSNENNQPNALYRNDGPQGFTALTGNAIVQAPHRSSTGSSWADVDNDGGLDLFVANYNQNNQLFLNLGNGNFEAVSEGAIVSDGGHSFGSTFADIDNDGDLDLFVANGFGPATGVENFLYINRGDGTFERDEQSILDIFVRLCLENGSEVETKFDTGSGFELLLINQPFLELNKDEQATIDSTGVLELPATTFSLCSAPGQKFTSRRTLSKPTLIYEALVGSGIFKEQPVLIDIPKKRMIIYP